MNKVIDEFMEFENKDVVIECCFRELKKKRHKKYFVLYGSYFYDQIWNRLCEKYIFIRR